MCACFFNNNFYKVGIVFAMFCDHVWVKKWKIMPETEGKMLLSYYRL